MMNSPSSSINTHHQTEYKSKVINYFSIGLKPGKIPELDGLRAFAIILVLLFHFATFYREYHGSYFVSFFHQTIQNFLFNGWVGVDLFFVLSGYLIFYHLLSLPQENKTKSFTKYALKRIFRTFPLYYAIIIMIGLGLIPFYSPKISWSDYLIHMAFLQDYAGETILTPLWSLATEEKFYILAPFLLIIIQRFSPIKSIIFITITLVLITIFKSVEIDQFGTITSYITFFTHFRAPFHYAITSIGFGVVVALLVQHPTPRALPITALISAAVILTILLFTNLYRSENWHGVNWLHFILIILFGVTVWTSIKKTGAGYIKFLTGRLLRVISTLSYALYLTHYAVLPLTNKIHKAYVYSEEAWIHAGAFFLIYITFTLAFSLCLHYAVEKPFLILKERL